MDIREVPAAQMRWEVSWQDLLVMEPRMSSSTAAGGMPDRLVVHRKGRPGVEEPAPLTHELRIFPNTPQVTPRRPFTCLLLLGTRPTFRTAKPGWTWEVKSGLARRR